MHDLPQMPAFGRKAKRESPWGRHVYLKYTIVNFKYTYFLFCDPISLMGSNLLEQLLTSKARTEIFRLLFLGVKPRFYLRDLARHAGITAPAVQKEIRNLRKLDVISEEKDGNRIYYYANKQHPIYNDIKNIVEKLAGPVPVLKEALTVSEIKAAFIFGSIARGDPKAASDVDLMIIGNIGLREVSSLLSGVSEKLGREINPHVYSEAEFFKRLKAKNHFLIEVLKTQKKFIVGSEHELERMGKARLAKTA